MQFTACYIGLRAFDEHQSSPSDRIRRFFTPDDVTGGTPPIGGTALQQLVVKEDRSSPIVQARARDNTYCVQGWASFLQ